MKVAVLYFAGVRDLLGLSEETLSLDAPKATLGALQARLAELHPTLEGRLGSVRFAINEAFAEPDAVLSDGDTVAVIPPVSGG